MGTLCKAAIISTLVASAATQQISIYDGTIGTGWASYPWGVSKSDFAYIGAPTTSNGKAAIQATLSQYGALSFLSNNGFGAAESVSFQIAGTTVPNFAVYLQVGFDGNAVSAPTQLHTICEPMVDLTYTTCTYPLSSVAPSTSGEYNRINFQNWGTEQVVYLANVYLNAPSTAGKLAVYDGAVSAGWEDVSWNLVNLDKAYLGLPRTNDAKAAIKAKIGQYNAFSYLNHDGFADATALSFDIAAEVVPNFAVYFQIGVGGAQSKQVQITASCTPMSALAYSTCKLDLSAFGANPGWTRVIFQNWGAENTVYLSNIYFSVPTGPTPTPTPSVNREPITMTGSTATPTLKTLANALGAKYFGSEVVRSDLFNQPLVSILNQQFDVLTPGNELKWGSLEPSQGQYNWAPADAIVDYALSKGIRVRGHTLVWHSQLPNWVEYGVWTPESLTALIQNHIATVMGRYKGKLFHWDVVNEIFNEDGTWRQSVFYRVLGEDFVRIAFEAARVADPSAKLYINDYNIEYSSAKATSLVNLVKSLVDQRVPIDGIGSQAHLVVGQVQSSFAAQLEYLASPGVDVAITELDIRMKMPVSSPQLVQQAKDYETVAAACKNVVKCVGVSVWGLTDASSWIPSTFPGEGAGLPWDEDYLPKPAFNGIVSGLGGTPLAMVYTPTVPDLSIQKIFGGVSGLDNGWENWSWSPVDLFYDGQPRPVVGLYSLRGDMGGYGGVSFKSRAGVLKSVKRLVFYAVATSTNINVRFEDVEGGLASEYIPISSVCSGTLSTTAYTFCSVDLSKYSNTATANRINFQSAHPSESYSIMLSNVYLTSNDAPVPLPSPVIPSPSEAPSATSTDIPAPTSTARTVSAVEVPTTTTTTTTTVATSVASSTTTTTTSITTTTTGGKKTKPNKTTTTKFVLPTEIVIPTAIIPTKIVIPTGLFPTQWIQPTEIVIPTHLIPTKIAIPIPTAVPTSKPWWAWW